MTVPNSRTKRKVSSLCEKGVGEPPLSSAQSAVWGRQKSLRAVLGGGTRERSSWLRSTREWTELE